MQVLVVDALVLGRSAPPASTRRRRPAARLRSLMASTAIERSARDSRGRAQHDRDVLLARRLVEQPGRHARRPPSATTADTSAARSPAAAAFSVSTSRRRFGWSALDVPVDVDDAGGAARTIVAHLSGHSEAPLRDRARRPRRPASAAPAGRAAPRRPGCRRARAGRRRDRVRARRRFAIAWLCSLRSSLPTRFTCRSAMIRLAPQEVVPHQTVEVVRRRRAGVASVRSVTSGSLQRLVGKRRARPARSPRAACPRACRTTTWNSLLLSNGSIFTVTKPSGTSAIAPTRSTATSAEKRRSAAAACAMSGAITSPVQRASCRSSPDRDAPCRAGRAAAPRPTA